MDIVSYSEARANLKDVMDRVIADHSPTVVTRRKGDHVVMVSLADWSAMAETNYLLSTPANARRLREAVAQLDAGKGKVRKLHQS